MYDTLEQLQIHREEAKRRLASIDARKTENLEYLAEVTQECEQLTQSNTELMASLGLLEQCNIAARDFVKVEIEQLVTQGLRSIFGDPSVKFSIDFTSRRNQIEADFSLSREGEENPIQGDILSTYGGGVVDVISISLRIIVMQLMKIKGPLILDEPGKNISAQYVGAFGKFLTEVSNTFERQIIIVTHNSKLVEFSNNTIEVYQIRGISHVR